MNSIRVDYYEKLDNCFEMFDDAKKLKYCEAKMIAEAIKKSKGQEEKEKLQEELLMGTMHEVYKFIKDNGLLVLCDAGYVEFEDLISSLTLAWAEDLDNRVLEAGRYSTLFSREYFEDVAKKLGVADLSDTLKIRGSGYLGALGTYYRDKDNGVEVSSYFDYTFATGMPGIEELQKKTKEIIERSYQLYKDTCFINSDNTALLGFYGMIFTEAVVRDGKYVEEEDLQFTDDVIARVDVDKIILRNRRLTDYEKRILIERFGFDGKGDKTFDEMSDNYPVGACRLGQITAKSLRKLRGDKKVRQYNLN